MGQPPQLVGMLAITEARNEAMARLTLIQQKNRPIHRIRNPGSSGVLYTWCGTDPCRWGVSTEGFNSGTSKATCKRCLREERKAIS
jgi:hypothetical protein